MDVLIATTAHDRADGRLARHVAVLRAAGITADVVSLAGRGRLRRFVTGPLALSREVRRRGAPVVVLPDPELHVLLPALLRRRRSIVCDVHENYRAVVSDRSWIPTILRPLVRGLVGVGERIRDRWADAVLVADRSVIASAGVLVTNRPDPAVLPDPVPAGERPALIYVGDIRESRGLTAMLDLVVATKGVSLDLIGPVADEAHARRLIADRKLEDRVTLAGRLPYNEAWVRAAGSLAGLSLLQPTPAFVDVVPTKVWEYWAVGLPVLATPLPAQAALITAAGGGCAADAATLAAQVEAWRDDPGAAAAVGRAGRRYYENADDGSRDRLVTTVRTMLDLAATRRS